MPISVFDIYQDVLDRINEPSGGQLSVDRYNRFSWIAQLNLIDWLSGSIGAKQPPQMYDEQKIKDSLSTFITSYPVQVVNGKIQKPSDYYLFENMYLLGQFNEQTSCYEEVVENGVNANTAIQILNGDKFTIRSQTYIEGLKPSFTKPITKLVGNNFEFNPTDLGSITLEYIRYPIRSKLVMKEDSITHDEVYDEGNSINFEFEEYARGILTWYIVDQYANFSSNQSLKQDNILTGKTK